VVEGKLNEITQEGEWAVTGKTYSTPVVDAGKQGKLLTIRVNMNVGSLTLTTQ
jgi:hypothetical protein